MRPRQAYSKKDTLLNMMKDAMRMECPDAGIKGDCFVKKGRRGWELPTAAA